MTKGLWIHVIVWVSTAVLSGGLPPQTRARGADGPPVIAVLIDQSASMASIDTEDATPHAVLTLLGIAFYDAPTVVVIGFSSKENVIMAPRKMDRREFNALEKELLRRRGGGTHLAAAFHKAMDIFSGLGQRRLEVVILSDGRIPDHQAASLRAQTEDVASAGVRVHSIGLAVPAGSGNILEHLATRTGGNFYPISRKDLVNESHQAAIRLALSIMKNHLHQFTDSRAPLRIPREVRRLVAVVPKGASLIGPRGKPSRKGPFSMAPGVVADARDYAGWSVISAKRPDRKPAVLAGWKGEWIVVAADGQRATGFGFAYSDLELYAAADGRPTADSHLRVKVESRRSPAASREPKGPFDVAVFLRPRGGIALPATRKTMQDNGKALEVELAPVYRPGAYELVARAFNQRGFIAAEYRQDLSIRPSEFVLRVLSSTPNGKDRVLIHTGNRSPHDGAEVRAGEKIHIAIDPRLERDDEVETLSGGLTLRESGKSPVTRELHVVRSGSPQLELRDLLIGAETRIELDVRAVVLRPKDDPFGGRTTARHEIKASWGFSLKADPPPAYEIAVAFVPPEIAREGSPCRVGVRISTTGTREAARLLEDLAPSVSLRVTRGGRLTVETASPAIESTRISGPAGTEGRRTMKEVFWTLPPLEAGRYSASVSIEPGRRPAGEDSGKPPITTFDTTDGGFEVTAPWISCSVVRINREGGSFDLKGRLELLDGDEIVVDLQATSAFPVRLVEHTSVSGRVGLPSAQAIRLSVEREELRWKTRAMRPPLGESTMRITVKFPGGAGEPITKETTIEVHPLKASLRLEGPSRKSWPRDAVVPRSLRLTADNERTLRILSSESSAALKLLDETAVVVWSDDVPIDATGVARFELDFERPGHFQLRATTLAPGATPEIREGFRVTPEAFAFRLLARPPDVNTSIEDILRAPLVPAEVERGASLTPIVVPTSHFPFDHSIVSARLRSGGNAAVELGLGELYRFYEGFTFRSDRRDQQILAEVKLARDGEGPGMLLRQGFDLEIETTLPMWLKLLLWGLSALFAVRLLREWFAVAGMVSITEPFLLEAQGVNCAGGRFRRFAWPRVRFRVGASCGELAVPREYAPDTSGALLTLRRAWDRRLRVRDHASGECFTLGAGDNTIPAGPLVCDFSIPTRAAMEATNADA